MEKQAYRGISKGKRLIVLGFVVIGLLFMIYERYQDPELITPSAIDTIQRIAYGFYITLVASFGAIAFGMYRYHKGKVESKGTDLSTIIALVAWNSKSRKIFVATFVIYGIFFSLLSGTLVYQPEVNFAIHYGATIPSGFIAPCCAEPGSLPGYMPKIIIYITEHVGLQIIPLNLVLQVIVSYLVGLNVSIAASAYSISKKGRGIGGIGAIIGLFMGCPTCAGTFLSVFIGTASGIALSMALTQMQTLFIAISIPLLIATPYIMAKKLRNQDGSCKI